MNEHLHSRLRATLHKLPLSMICVCLACGAHRARDSACPAVEMSAVADTQSDSTRSVALNDSRTIHLDRTPIVSNADITRADVSQTGDQWALEVNVTDAAAKRIEQFSSQHVGRTIALLVDGKVRGTPRIMGPIKVKKFQITGFERAEAERLQAELSNGCQRER